MFLAMILQVKQLFPDRLICRISQNLLEVAKFCKEMVVLLGEEGCRALRSMTAAQMG